MMMLMKGDSCMRRVMVLGMVLLSGCATTTPASEAVRTVNSEGAVKDCRYVTSVRGDQNLYGGMLFARAAYDDAIAQMQVKAAKAGANTLYVAQASTGFIGANARGDAYRC